jgi:hypothetical protein
MDNRSLMTADFSFKNLGKTKRSNAVINGLQLYLSSSLLILMEKFPREELIGTGPRGCILNQQRLFGNSPATRPLKFGDDVDAVGTWSCTFQDDFGHSKHVKGHFTWVIVPYNLHIRADIYDESVPY